MDNKIPTSNDEIFVSHKQVKRTPMTLGEYNIYRNWRTPKDESTNAEGYLVEYLDGCESNHPNHKGYISWSPKEQFDNGYSLLKESTDNSPVNELSASEAVYGIFAWLTCLQNPVTFSGSHNASIGAEMAQEFCEINNLSEVPENWPNNLTLPNSDWVDKETQVNPPSDELNYKTLHNSTVSGAKGNVSDLIVYGNGDTFQLICKASSKAEGWMKSTKAMEIPNLGCVVQVTTQQGANVAEALTFVSGATIELIDPTDKSKGRKLVSRKMMIGAL